MTENNPAAVLDSPQQFSLWWNTRAHRADRTIVDEAVRRGLIRRGRGLLFLTEAGKALRDTARHPRSPLR